MVIRASWLLGMCNDPLANVITDSPQTAMAVYISLPILTD